MQSTKRMERLWIQMNAMYGSRWLLDYGECANKAGELEPVAEIWACALESVSNEQIAAGLKSCLERESQHSPGLPEFLRLCGASMTGRHAEYRAQSLQPNPNSPHQRAEEMAERLQAEANSKLTAQLAGAVTPQQRANMIRAYWMARLGETLIGEQLIRQWRTA